MGTKKARWLLGAAACAVIMPASSQASETVTYVYDTYGRLVAVTTSGGPINGQSVTTTYDPAGNRTNHTVVPGAAPPPPPPSPPPPPPLPPPNQPPVAVADTASVPCHQTVNIPVVANDHDPDNNTPLTLMSVVRTSGTIMNGTAQVVGNNVRFVAGRQAGVSTFTYTIRDSLNASAQGTLTVTIVDNGTCRAW